MNRSRRHFIQGSSLAALAADARIAEAAARPRARSVGLRVRRGKHGLAAGIVAIAAAALLLYCERLDGAGAIGPERASAPRAKVWTRTPARRARSAARPAA